MVAISGLEMCLVVYLLVLLPGFVFLWFLLVMMLACWKRAWRLLTKTRWKFVRESDPIHHAVIKFHTTLTRLLAWFQNTTIVRQCLDHRYLLLNIAASIFLVGMYQTFIAMSGVSVWIPQIGVLFEGDGSWLGLDVVPTFIVYCWGTLFHPNDRYYTSCVFTDQASSVTNSGLLSGLGILSCCNEVPNHNQDAYFQDVCTTTAQSLPLRIPNEQFCQSLHTLRTFRIYSYNVPWQLEPQMPSFAINQGLMVEQYFSYWIRNGPLATTNPTEAHMAFIPVSIYSQTAFHPGAKEATGRAIVRSVERWLNGTCSTNECGQQLSTTEKDLWDGARAKPHCIAVSHDGGRDYLADAPILARTAVALTNTADVTQENSVSNQFPVVLPFRASHDVSTVPLLTYLRRPHSQQHRRSSSSSSSTQPRTLLASFVGLGLLGAPEYNVRAEIRNAVYRVVEHDPMIKMVNGHINKQSYRDLIQSSEFCLHIRGFRGWSPRLFEYLQLGCIPVIVADGYQLPLSDVIDWTTFAIIIAEKNINEIPKVLRAAVSKAPQMRNVLKRIAPLFQYNPVPVFGDVWWLTMLDLFTKLNTSNHDANFVQQENNQTPSWVRRMVQAAAASGKESISERDKETRRRLMRQNLLLQGEKKDHIAVTSTSS